MTSYDIRPAVKALADLVRDQLVAIGAGAQLQAAVAGGEVTAVSVASAGTGYKPYTRLRVDGGGGVAAWLDANISAGAVAGVDVISGGRGYTNIPAVVPAPWLANVYEEIPDNFADTGGFCFFDYLGAGNTRDAHEGYGAASSERVWRLEWVVGHALVQHVAVADRMTKSFVGVGYDLIRKNSSLGGVVDDAIVVSDRIEPVAVSGGSDRAQTWLANIFTVEITDFVE